MRIANLKRTLRLVLAQGLALGLTFAFQVALARVLGPFEFGRFVFFLSCFNLSVLVGKVGLDQLMLRDVRGIIEARDGDAFHTLRKTATRTVLAVSIPLSLVLFSGLYVWLQVVSEYSAIALASACLAVTLSAVTALNAQSLISVGNVLSGFAPEAIVRPVLMLAAIGSTVIAGQLLGLFDVLFMFAVVCVLTWSLSEAMYRRKITLRVDRRRLPGPTQESETRTIVLEALPMFFVAATFLMATQTDILVLGLFSSAEQVASYSVASRLAMLTQLGLIASQSAMASQIRVSFNADDHAELQRSLDLVAVSALGFAAVSVTAIVGFAPSLLALFGPEFTDARTPLFLLLVYQIVNCATGATGVLMNMTGLQRQCAVSLVFAVGANVALSIPLAMSYGALGVALATVATMSAWNIAMTLYVYRRRAVRTWISFSTRVAHEH